MARKERKTVSQVVLGSGGNVNIPVLLSNATIYTKAFRIDDADRASITAVLGLDKPTGTAKITVVVEQGYEPPLVQGSAHPGYVDSDVVMNTFGTIATYTRASITISGLRYARCRITAVTPNTSAYINVNFHKQTDN